MKGHAIPMIFAAFLALTACGAASSPPEAPGASAAKGQGELTANHEGAPGATAGASVQGPVHDPPTSAEVEAGNRAFDAGDFTKARASFEAAVKKNPKDFGAYFNLGQTCEKLDDKSCAEASYKSALVIEPALDLASASLGNLYIESGRLDDALSVAKKGLVARPGSGALHETLALALAAGKQRDAATQEFEQALKIAPGDAMFHFNYAHWLNVWQGANGTGPHVDAGAQLDAAAAQAKDDVPLLASIGFEYRMARMPDPCIKIFDRAVELKDGGEVRTERALCKLALKDEKGGLDDLQAAVRVEPGYATAHYYLAGRLAMQKHFKEAIAEYQKYLELAPEGSLAKQAGEKMKRAEQELKKK